MNIDKLIFNFEDVMEPRDFDEFVLDVEMKKKNYDYSFMIKGEHSFHGIVMVGDESLFF